MDRKLLLGVTGFGVALVVTSRLASAGVNLDPQTVMVGGFAAQPTASLRTVYDDNIYKVEKDAVSSFYQIVNPTIKLIKQDQLNVYSLTYSLRAGMYANDSNDSFNDHLFGADAHIEPNDRLRFDGNIKYGLLHDDRGSGLTGGSPVVIFTDPTNVAYLGEVDKYKSTAITGGFKYGAEDARGVFSAKTTLSQKRYSRLKASQIGDTDDQNTSVGMLFKIAEKSSLVVDVDRDTSDYQKPFNKLKSSVSTRYLAGFAWQNSVQTSGKVRFGKGKKTTDEGVSLNRQTWDVGVKWNPVDADTITLNAEKKVRTADAKDDEVNGRKVDLAWSHDWLDRFTTKVSYTNTDDSYKKGRKDTGDTYGIGAKYQLRRSVIVGADLTSKKNDSTKVGQSLDQKTVSVGIQLSL